MTKKNDTTLEDLNLVNAEAARAFLDLQCHMRYSLYEIRECLESGMDHEEILEHLDYYESEIRSKVLDCGRANEKGFELAGQLIKGLVRPPIASILRFLRLIYGEYAGWK